MMLHEDIDILECVYYPEYIQYFPDYYIQANYYFNYDFKLTEKSTSLNEVLGIFPELFLGLSILFLIIHGILLSSNKKKNYPLIHNSIINLGILALIFTFILINNNCIVNESSLFNNTIVIDNIGMYSKQMIVLSSILCLIVIKDYLNDTKTSSFEYIILILFSILGILLLCSSNDLITAYLSIEVQSLSFYLLAAYKKNSIFSTEAGLKYFILGSFSSSLFLFGSSFIYGSTGTTNFEDFKDLYFLIYPENLFYKDLIYEINLLELGLVFLIISLFFKLSLAPFHLWSPDIYEGSLTSSTIFFAVLPKLGLFVLLVRIFYYSFHGLIDNWKHCFIGISLLSIIIGSFGGLEQKKIKSLFAYSSITHMGYSLISFSTGTFEGLQVLLCYIFIYMLSGICIWSIFLSIRLKYNYLKKTNKDLADFLLLSKSNKILAMFFSISLLSLSGFPPLIGFYAKFNVFLVSIESTFYFAALFGILCSVISTFYYVRIIKILYFEKKISGKLYYPINYQISLIISICFVLFIFLFLNPNLIYLFFYKISSF